MGEMNNWWCFIHLSLNFISLFVSFPPSFLFCFYMFCMSRKFMVINLHVLQKLVCRCQNIFIITKEEIFKRLDRRSPSAPIHSGANPLTGKSELKPLAAFPVQDKSGTATPPCDRLVPQYPVSTSFNPTRLLPMSKITWISCPLSRLVLRAEHHDSHSCRGMSSRKLEAMPWRSIGSGGISVITKRRLITGSGLHGPYFHARKAG